MGPPARWCGISVSWNSGADMNALPMHERMSAARAERLNDSAVWPPWICAVDGQPLGRRRDRLVCGGGHAVPIRRGIPRFVDDAGYAAAFGAQWTRYRRTQLDSYTGTTITRDRVRRCLGEALWDGLRDRHVLECGCGAGRFTEILLARGARVTSVDITEAVEAQAENFPASAHHRIAQADILGLPFAPQQYDLVLCLGVIQHTPDPEETIARLYDQVKPGGHLVLDHYAAPARRRRLTSLTPLYRRYLRRLPAEDGLRFTESLVHFFFPLHKLARRSLLAERMLARISPVATAFHAYPELPDRVHFEWALLETHDALTDWHKHFRTRAQIQHTLHQLWLQDIVCES